MEIKLFLLLLLSSLHSLLCRITVLSPKALKEKFKNRVIKASYSNFGKIPYGYTLSGRVYFDPNNKDEDMACKPIKSIHVEKDPLIDKAPIVLIDRGTCYFVEKVKNVEDIGGHVALIVDNKKEDPTTIIMSDDSRRRGQNIHIPALLISKEDGKIIENFYRENKDKKDVLESIILEIEFQMEHPSNEVHYSFFFSSTDFNVYTALREIYHYHKHLRDHTKFTPYYVSSRYQSHDGKARENCYAGGNFCASPRHDLGIGDGRQILKENLRQKCIYNYAYNVYQNSTDMYWEYMKNFYDNCLKPPKGEIFFSDNCALTQIVKTQIDPDQITKCIYNSFGLEPRQDGKEDEFLTTKANTLLYNDNDEKEKHNLWLTPSLLINKRTFWGSWTGEYIFEAICASFKNKPEVCYDEGAFFKAKQTGLSFGIVIFLIILIIVFNLIIFLICRKFIKRKITDKIEQTDIDLKINTVVTSYLALKEIK